MKIENVTCTICSRVFRSATDTICGICMNNDDMLYRMVRDYIYDHPENTAGEVSLATGVPIRKINDLLSKERIKMVDLSAFKKPIPCENCGKPIKFGTLCEPCWSSQMKASKKKSNRFF
jgi:hypothetical protein